MDEDKARQNALYDLLLNTAEKVSDRRAQANTYLLSVNSAIVGLHGYLQEGKASVGAVGKPVWLWAIPAPGSWSASPGPPCSPRTANSTGRSSRC